MENNQAFDEDWRPLENEDEDWPARTALSLANGEQERGFGDRKQNITDTKSAVSLSKEASDDPDREGPIKLNFITRPVSSHEDPAAGFSFSKAKPITFNFSRQRKESHPSALSNQTLQSHPAKEQGPFDPIPPPLSEKLSHAACNTPQQSDSLQDSLPKTLEGTESQPTPQPGVRASGEHGTSTSEAEHAEVGAPATTTNQVVASLSTENTLVTDDQSVEESMNQNGSHVSGTAIEPSAAGGPLIVATGNATKPHRKNKRTASLTANAHRSMNPRPLHRETADNVLDLVANQIHRIEKERDTAIAMYNAKVQENEQVSNSNGLLYAELLNFKKEVDGKESALAKLHETKAGLEKRVKKLCDFVKGLSNDHNQLRDTAQEMRDRHLAIRNDKQAVDEAIRAVHDNMERDSRKSKSLVSESRRHIEALNKTVENLRRQLLEKEQHLDVALEKNQHFKEEISRITTSHDQLLSGLQSHSDTLNQKLDAMANRAESTLSTGLPQSHEQVTQMLDRCIIMIQELVSRRVARPEDLHKLDASMKNYTENVLSSMRTYEQASNAAVSAQQKIAISVQEELRAMCGNMQQKDALKDQIIDLREAKAIIGERMQQTDVSLARAQQEVIAFREKDTEKSREIMRLRLQIEKALDSPKTIQHVHELESSNSSLKAQMSTAQATIDELSNQIQGKNEEATQMADRLDQLQINIQEAKSREAAMEIEQSRQTEAAAAEREKIKKAVSEAASLDKINTRRKHENEMYLLKQRLKAEEENHRVTIKKMESLRSEQEPTKATIASLQTQNETLLKETTAQALRIMALEPMEATIASLQTQNETLLKETIAQALRIMALEALEGRLSQISSGSPSPHVNRPQQFDSPPTVIEDSQPKEINSQAGLNTMNSGVERDVQRRDERQSLRSSKVGLEPSGFHGTRRKGPNAPKASASEVTEPEISSSQTQVDVRDVPGKTKPASENNPPADPPNTKGGNSNRSFTRGILKENSSTKRDTSAAGLASAAPAPSKKIRPTNSQTSTTIADSQPPAPSSRKMASRPGTKTTAGERMAARFQRELEFGMK